MDLSQVHAEQRVEHRAHVERQRVGGARGVSRGRQRGRWRRARCAKVLQRALDGLITLPDGLLVSVVELQRLGEREDVLFPIVAGQRVPDRLDARLAAGVAVLGQLHRVAVARDNRAHDAHPRLARDVGHDVMKLDVHLHQGLLHVLNVCRCIFDQPFPLTQIRA